MTKEHRNFVIRKIRDLWAVCCFGKIVKAGFKTKNDAIDYRLFLNSR